MHLDRRSQSAARRRFIDEITVFENEEDTMPTHADQNLRDQLKNIVNDTCESHDDPEHDIYCNCCERS